MNRISRRPEGEAAEALLEAGRTQSPLHYDVELGLARHHHWLRSEAPVPEWASASASTAAKSLTSIVIKTIVSGVLVGTLGVAVWHARSRPQPSAADVKPPAPGTDRTRAVAPGAQAEPASEPSMAPIPMPVPVSDSGQLGEQPSRRTVDVPTRRSTRSERAHEGRLSARAASARSKRAVPPAEPAGAPARVEPAAPATTGASEDASSERATRDEIAAAPEPEREPFSEAREARPEPERQAQAPDDLAEMQQVSAAERLLERSPARALALVRQGDQRFARGYFQQERAYIAIMALIRLGRIDEARARAASFAKQFPELPYGARIRNALDAREAATPGAAPRNSVP